MSQIQPIPHGNIPAQSFSRLFPNLSGLNAGQLDLELLSKTMLDPAKRGPLDGSVLPAGLTYLGQFIDHDLTLEQSSILGTTVDPTTLPNTRTSWFDLDNVYGLSNEFLNAQGLFDIGKNSNGEDDLPRNTNGIAIIADARDEENLIISQIQLLFLKFHNKVFNEIKTANPNLTVNELIVQAKQIVTWHYQYIVVNDFLAKMCGKFFSRLFDANGNPVISQEIQAISPSLSIEFSGAVYRYGHSLVRDAYYLNSNFDVFPLFSSDLPSPLVTIPDLRGFKPLPPNQTIDWSMFFPMPHSKGFQVTEHMDPFITEALYKLPFSVTQGPPPILPLRNLMRGVVYGLPSGQDLARAYGIPESEVLASSKGNLVFQSLNTPLVTQADLLHLTQVFGEQTPLFYYTLKDNHVNGDGIHLGSLPSKLIGETFLNLLKTNPDSYISNNFKPIVGQYGCIIPDKYTMTELICYTLGIPYSTTDIVPDIYSNYYDPLENRQNTVATVGHPLVPSLGNPLAPAGDAVVNPFPGRTVKTFDPTLTPPINVTQTEINQVANNAVKNNVDAILAIVQFFYNKIILGIAQGLILPLAPPAPKADILPPSTQLPPNLPPVINLTPDQLRAKAIFAAIDKASFMLQPDAITDATRAAQEVSTALTPGAIPPILQV